MDATPLGHQGCFGIGPGKELESRSARPTKEATSWIAKHKQVREDLGIGAGAAWSDAGKKAMGVHTRRAKDLLDIAWAHSTAQSKTQDLIADVTHSAARLPWGCGFRAMTTSTTFFVFAEDRICLPAEHLRILGFPQNVQHKCVSGAQLKELCGQAMAVPCITLAATAVALALPELWLDAEA